MSQTTPATTAMLDDVRIATPCVARWEDMSGDERVRRCGLCKLDVYNVAELSRDEAETLLRERTGRTCMRIFRRDDGTVITRDCPSALRTMRRRAAWAAAALIAVGVTVAAMLTPRGESGVKSTTPAVPGATEPPLRPMMGETSVKTPDPMMGKAVMGDVCVPPPPVKPAK